MQTAFLFGIIATSSLLLGGILGLKIDFGRRLLGVIMAFGAGVLLSAVAYELTADAVRSATFTGAPALGFIVGALVFFLLDMIIGKAGGADRKAIEPHGSDEHGSHLVVPLVLAIILDGIPESAVVGLGILEHGHVSMAMVVAVFISNLPEAIAGTAGMKAKGRSGLAVMTLWFVIVLLCGFASAAGFVLMGDASETSLAFIKMFAGGAILMMLSNTMIPEAYAHGGKLAGIFTVLGFMVSVIVILFEKV